jgi:CHAD domain-containing protein
LGIFPFSFLSKTFIHGENLAKKIAKSLGPVRDEAVFDKSIFLACE